MIGAFGNNIYSINLATGSGQTIPIANVYLGHIHVWPGFKVTPTDVITDSNRKSLYFHVTANNPEWSFSTPNPWLRYRGTTAITNSQYIVEFDVDYLNCVESNTIVYTSTDGNIVTPNNSDRFGANIVSNTYYSDEDYGIMLFDGDVTQVGYQSFRNCKTLKTIWLPDSVTDIGWDAFYYCSGLVSMKIPDSVIEIGDNAFAGRLGVLTDEMQLSSVTIGSGCTEIGINCFFNCEELIEINYNGTMAQWANVEKHSGWHSSGVPATVVHCLDGDVNI